MDSTTPLVLDPTGTDIQGESAQIRARGPVTQVELPGKVRAWAVTDQAILKALLASPKVSKDPRQHWPDFQTPTRPNGAIGPEWELYTWVGVQNMFTAYGADHKRLRKLVAPGFTLRRTQAMRPRVEAIAAELIEDLRATPPGQPVDLREAFCYSLPIRVISELMGVPDDLNPGLRRCVDGIFDTTFTPEQAMANFIEMREILGQLVAYRRANPGEDMTSLLITHRDDETDPLTDQELVDTLLLVITAGHETTVNLLDQAIYLLLTQPDQLAKVIGEEPAATWEDVVEEALRHQAPVAHLPLRYAAEDIDIDTDEGSVHIAAGEPILASYAAAGRDAKVHGETADTFDVTRTNKEHLSFGYGAHHCLGAPLARIEGVTALRELFAAFPGMTLAKDPDEFHTITSFISNGHTDLPVHLN